MGLNKAADRPLRKYSKGMLQRAGLAQALMGDPELLILDEPMTGLDPLGRKEVRDLIVSLRAAGKTIVFSTHILPDVELICDRVAILDQGAVRNVGPLNALVSARILSTEIVFQSASSELADALRASGLEVHAREGLFQVVVPENGDVDAVIRQCIAAGARVVQVTPRQETLEDVFVRAVAS